jgi:signal transduction histidine kinase
MNEKIIYSLKDLILINQNKNKLLYFEIVEESSSSSKSKLIGESESENISMGKYASSS